VLDASAVVRIIEGSALASEFQDAVQAEALALATHLDHPVVDCLYLVLARREVATLLSADQKLLELASKVLP
jgi:predicted nucleic acid-binding protein